MGASHTIDEGSFQLHLFFEAYFASFVRQISLRAQPLSSVEVLAHFGTASEGLHAFLYGYALEKCLGVSVNTPFKQTQWQRHHAKLVKMKSRMAKERSSRSINAEAPRQPLSGHINPPLQPTLASQSGQTIGQNSSRRPAVNTDLENSTSHERQSSGASRRPPLSAFLPSNPAPSAAPNSALNQSPSLRQRPPLPRMSAQGSLPAPTRTDAQPSMSSRNNSSTTQAQTGQLMSQQINQFSQAQQSSKPNSFFPHPDNFAPLVMPPDPSIFALHQTRLAIPQLLLTIPNTAIPSQSARRAYRYVSGFTPPPKTLNSRSTIQRWDFDVPLNLAELRPEQVRIISADVSDEAWRIQQDSILYRIRCVKWDNNALDNSREWVTGDHYWPPHVTSATNIALKNAGKLDMAEIFQSVSHRISELVRTASN